MFLELLLLLLIIIIGFLLIILPIKYMEIHPRTIFKMSKLPGPKGLFPVFGLAYHFSTLSETDLIQFYSYLHRNYQRLAAFWLLGIPQSILFDPDDIEVLLSSSYHIEKGQEYAPLKSWLEEGVVTSNGEKWHKRRRLLTPAFHFKILGDNIHSLNKHARHLVNNMLDKKGQPFVVEDLILPSTLNMFYESAMGYPSESQNGNTDNEVYLDAVRRVTELIAQRILNVAHRNNWVYALTNKGRESLKKINFIHNFTEKIIEERRTMKFPVNSSVEEANSEEDDNDENIYSGKRKKAFMDILIDLNKKDGGNLLNDNDIREEVETFMFAGHDTTQACIALTLYLLGKHPDIQERAYQELLRIFGDSDRAITRKDLNQMQYLEMIIKESLRIYPSVPFISRKINQDLHLRDNTILPAGITIAIMPYVIHRDPKFYPNPLVFDPERFTLENCKKRHPYAYIPFSAGPRNCIGQKFAMMELKLVLATIIRLVQVHSVNDVDENKFVPIVVLRSKVPIQIKISPRT